MDMLILLALLLAAPCFVQLVLWGAYAAVQAVHGRVTPTGLSSTS